MTVPRESAPDKNNPNRNHSGQNEADVCRHVPSPRKRRSLTYLICKTVKAAEIHFARKI
jgi:hypothetical protein